MDTITGSVHTIDGAQIAVTEHKPPEDFEDVEEFMLRLESGDWPSNRNLKRHFSGGKERRGSVQTMTRVAMVRLEQEEEDRLFERENRP